MGCGDPGVRPMTPKFEIGRDFCTVHLATMFYHLMFNRLEVILFTNKYTYKEITDAAAENTHLASLRYTGGNKFIYSSIFH